MDLTLFPRWSISSAWMQKQHQGFHSPLEPQGVGLATSGAPVPEREPSRSDDGRDVEGNNLFWRWGHTANTLCALLCGFTQAPHAFFIRVDLGALWALGEEWSKAVFSKAIVPLLPLAILWLTPAPRVAAHLSHPSQTRPWHRSLCLHVPASPAPPFFAQGCACSQHTSAKVLMPPWWEQQGWALVGGRLAADRKAARFFHKFFPVG